jgi:signal transduction histidine kinase
VSQTTTSVASELVRLVDTADTRLPEPIEVAAYFVASEALANAAKHAQVSRIDGVGGAIDIESATGGGTSLLVTLPLDIEPTQAARRALE